VKRRRYLLNETHHLVLDLGMRLQADVEIQDHLVHAPSHSLSLLCGSTRTNAAASSPRMTRADLLSKSVLLDSQPLHVHRVFRCDITPEARLADRDATAG
jgi:hypothetical protein